MSNLTAAVLFFLVSHLGLAYLPVRKAIIERLGDKIFLAAYSLVALAGLIWMITAYGDAPFEPVFDPGPGLRHLPILVMPIALFLVVCSVTGPNPTSVGQNPDADEAEPAKGIIRVTRHPMMWGVALWGMTHMLANGDQAALLFFGSLTLLALAGSHAIDAKRSGDPAPGWGVFVQSTSFWPFGAIIQGRNRFAAGEIGWIPLAITAVLYGLLLAMHPWLFGVSAMPF